MIKVALINLGCPKNQVEGEYMLGVLEEAGFHLESSPYRAQVVVVNTCAFIRAAREESLGIVRSLNDIKNRPLILLAGCLPQYLGAQAPHLVPQASAFLGPGAIPQLPAIIKQALAGKRPMKVPEPQEEKWQLLPRLVTTFPYAYIKISEGCRHRCTFCTIPRFKGPYRSRPLKHIVSEAAALVRAGIKELILVGQETTSYGLDLYGRPALSELLKNLSRLEGLKWIRLLYLHPSGLTPALVEALADIPRVLTYLDIPLQHVSPRILKKMGREGGPEAFLKLLSCIRQTLPGVCLRTTFMVGFPGEGEEDFSLLLDFLREARFDWAGAFKYSPEPFTPAASLYPQVPEEIKEERLFLLMEEQRDITRQCNTRWLGEEMEVLVEKPGVGRTFRQAPEIDGRIYFSKKTLLSPGQMVKMRMEKLINPYDFWGRITGKNAETQAGLSN